MRRFELTIRRFAGLSALFALPGCLAMLVLAFSGLLAAVPALLAAIAVAAGSALGVLIFGRDAVRVLTALAATTDADQRGEEPEPTAATPATELGRVFAGEIARLRGVWQHRTLHLRTELWMRSSIADSLDDPLLVLDVRRVVRWANRTAIGLFGERSVGRDLAGSLRHPDVLAAVDDVLAGGGGRVIEFTEPVPVERVFEARVKPFAGRPDASQGDESAASAALLGLHDITANKRIQQMRADFVANASHELRTPLSTLIGFIETLRGPAHGDSEAQERFLAIMEEQAARMQRLVSDLLSLSRIEQDEHSPPTGRVDVVTVLRQVVDLLELRAADRGMTLAVRVADGLPAVIGDEDQLIQVFQNLVINAIKYGRASTEVTIDARPAPVEAGAAVAISVRDRGEGIERSHIPRLTERFYRVDPARSRALGGTGLGLAIVKHILSRHRGRLIVDSIVGQGSTFTAHLPAAAPEAEAVPTTLEDGARASPRPHSVGVTAGRGER